MTTKGVQKRVVIVGGGAAGGHLARELSKKLGAQYELTLINDRPFFVHLPGMARIPVSDEDHLEDTALFGFDKLLHNGNGSVKIGKAVAIAETAPGKGGEVVLEDGERVSYDSLVLATGCTWPSIIELPRTEADTRAHLSSWRAKVAKAQHVVIVGGGAVGIELAGEIRYAHPKKSVTLIHRDSLLLNATYPDKYRKDIERRARARGVDIILDDAIEDLTEFPTGGVTTQKGKSIPGADLVIQAFGSKPKTEFIKSLGEGVVNTYGFVKVDEQLQVPGHPGVFVIGDIMDWKEQKQAAKAGTQAGVIVPNLLSFLQGQPLKKVYKGSLEMILIPLGKTGGSGYFDILWGLILGDFFAKMIKGKDLMIGMVRSQRGL